MDPSSTTEVHEAVVRLLRRLPALGERAPAADGSGGVRANERLPPWLLHVAQRDVLAPLAGVEVQFGAIDDPDLAEEVGEDWFVIDLTAGRGSYDDEIEELLLSRYVIIGGSSTGAGETLAVSCDGEDRAVYAFVFESIEEEISDGRDPVDALGELFADLVGLLDAITAVRPADA